MQLFRSEKGFHWVFLALFCALLGAAPALAVEKATPSIPVPSASPAVAEPKIKVTDIAVRGNKSVSSETILLSIPIRRGDEVTRQQIVESLERIYGLGLFMDVRAGTEPTPGGERLIFNVVENPPLEGVSIKGATVFKAEDLQKFFLPQVGKTMNFKEVQKSIKEMEAKYHEAGYVLARVGDVQIQPGGILELKVGEGRLESIKLAGLEETQDYVVRRELTLKQGDVFNLNRMSDDLRRVYNLNFFEDIGLKYEPGTTPDSVVVVVNLKEKQTGQFNMSAGWSTRDGPLGMLSLRKDNFLGRAQSVGADLTVGGLLDPKYRNVTTELNYFNPWIDQEHTSLGLSGYARRYNNFYGLFNNPDGTIGKGFIEDRRGGMISMGRPLFGDPVTSTWATSLRLRGERIGIYQFNPTDWRVTEPLQAASSTGTGWDTAYSAAISLKQDTRDYVLNPNKGWFNNYTVEQYLPFGDLHFTRFQLDVNNYQPMPFLKDNTFAVGLKTGTNFSTSQNFIPPYERFYSTGNNLIRGWDEAQFSGNSFALGSVEWRFPIVNVLSGVAFADSGLFWDQTSSREPFAWNRTRSGYGLGIRVNTPMGPLRLDLGTNGRDGFKPHFSIGQKF